MGIKNAGKAKIKKNLGKAPTRESVDTPMSECEAENPLECRYHGLQALEQQLSAVLPSLGYKIPFGTDKLQGGKGYEIRLDGKVDVEKSGLVDSLMIAFKKQGWDLTYNGKVEGAGHSFTLKKGNAKPLETTEEDDKDKDDVDLVDDGLFDDLDDLAGLELQEEGKKTTSENGDIDLMPLVGNPDALKDTDESDITLKDIEDFLAKNGTTKEHHYGDTPWEEILANWEGLIKDGQAPNGSKLEGLIDFAKGYMDAAGEDHKVTKALKAKIAEVTGEDVETKQEKKPSFEDAKDFLTKGHILEGDISDLVENIWGPIVFTGHFFHGGEVGEPWLEKFQAAVKELSDHPVTPYVKRWLNKSAETDEAENLEVDLDELDELAGSEMSDFDAPLEEAEGEVKGDDDILKDSWSLAGATKQKEATDKDMVEGFKESEAKQESPASAIIGGLDESLMKPLEHDESKFPPSLTQKELDTAIAKGQKAGGHGGLHTTIIEIGGKKYICKNGAGKKSNIIKNGFNADMAYRAGGVYAPDAKLYEFGDGKTYKLSEFIEGKKLIDVWKEASEAKREEIRKELLKGFPLDALFSNYDVLGTSPEESQTVTIAGADGKPQKTHVAFDNIMIGSDGHAYRIDNDGAFAMTGKGGHKSSSGGSYTVPVEAEHWDNWDERQWIDDFRTMRRNERNLGIFDRYTTANIFLAAGNINLNNAVSSLPKQLQKALAKPLFEMKQMTMRAVSAELSGFTNQFMLSTALDASYEASKKGWRQKCVGEISFSQGGIGAKKSDKGSLPPCPIKKPKPPEDPTQKFVEGAMLANNEYTGEKVSKIILDAAKTINYHAGFKMTDAAGNTLGGGGALPDPDYTPNSSKIAQFKKIDREKLAYLATESEEAKQILKFYDSVAISIDNGNKLPVQEVKVVNIHDHLPSGFKTKQETEYEEHKESVMAKYHAELKEYHEKVLPAYNNEYAEWEKNEKAKLRSGGDELTGNFYDIANDFMVAAYNTNGIAQHNGESIDFIELGKHQNKYGGDVSGATTENDSWTPASSHLKVLDLLMTGKTIEEIANVSDNDALINNGHFSGKTAKKWFMNEAKKMAENPEQTRREMAAYAVFKALQVVKLENESAKINLQNNNSLDWIDHACHTVGLIRKESFSNASMNKIAPIVQKGGNSSCGFQSNGAINYYPYAYDVPLWNVSYTYSDANHKDSKVSSHQGSEHEWVANLVGLTPFRVDESTDATHNIELYRKQKTLAEARTKRINRLKPFFTTLADIPQKVA